MTGLVTLVRAADARSSLQVDESVVSNASVLFRGVCGQRWLSGRGTRPWHVFANLRTFRKAFARPSALLYDGMHRQRAHYMAAASFCVLESFVRAGEAAQLCLLGGRWEFRMPQHLRHLDAKAATHSLCVTSQVFRCSDFLSCVRGGVRVRTHGCWGSCGCTTAPSVWNNGGRARERQEPPLFETRLELVMEATKRLTRGVRERCARSLLL